MKKILHIITLSEIGGAQKILFSVAKGIKSDFDITVVCSPGGELVYGLRAENIKVYELDELCREINIFKDLKAFAKTYSFIRKNRFDAVHCHSWKAGVIGRIAAYAAGQRNIFFTVHGWSILHTDSAFIRFLYLVCEKMLALITKKIICVCEMDKKKAVELGIAPEEKLDVIYNGIKKECEFDKRIRESFPPGSIIIGTVARMAKQKKVIETAKIMKELFIKYENLYFVWIGDGPLYEQMKQYVEDNLISDRFMLMGEQSEARKLICSFDIYMLLSNYEGLSVSILEAMSAGLPVIASDVGGVCEQVFEGINGYLVDDDFDNMLKKVSMLIDDRDKRESFGKAGRDIFISKFTDEKMVEGYRNILASGI